MRLASVEVIPYALPFKQPYVTARGSLEQRELVLLRLRDEQGTIGLGEGVPLSLRGGASAEQVVRELEALDENGALDRAIGELAAADQFEPGSEKFEGQEQVSSPARCAALMALRDLSERQRENFGFLAGIGDDSEPVPCNATLTAGPPEDVAADALHWAERGFTTFKLKLGAGEDDVAQVRAVREAVGPEAALRIDANGAWPLHTARRVLGELEEFDIEFAEQPVAETEEAAELAWQTRIPLAGDESITSYKDTEHAIMLGAFRLAGIKLSKVGGMPEAMTISRFIPSYVSSALDGPVGIAAGARVAQSILTEAANPYAPKFAHGLATQRLFAARVGAVECELRDGMLHPPSGPGLGIEIDEDALRAHRL
ncbi:MAG TPA: mandelate racemase/muconate lactonizing enzyme family protein [Solirubrobacterales bacterium]|jgi:L-alanine-DL-glutamate epimerase-like enolase superfamily enzyme|nr:mandelate racemase/muconate lactonizing enzyme family protein [Solirubrobacterales bacterium]